MTAKSSKGSISLSNKENEDSSHDASQIVIEKSSSRQPPNNIPINLEKVKNKSPTATVKSPGATLSPRKSPRTISPKKATVRPNHKTNTVAKYTQNSSDYKRNVRTAYFTLKRNRWFYFIIFFFFSILIFYFF